MQILYSITININTNVAAEWLEWMKTKHIPDVMNTEHFTEYRIARLLGDEDSGGVTYNIQYVCKNMAVYESYRDNHAPALQIEHTERYKDKFVAFRTLLEILG